MATDTGTMIFVVGEPNGQLKSVFERLSTQYKKRPDFKFAIVVGNLFAEDNEELADLLSGIIRVPLPTYFTVGSSAFPQSVVEKLSKDEPLCENLYYLPKRGMMKTSEGIKIVALGGILDTTIEGQSPKDDFSPVHSAEDAKALKGHNTADILLTSQWPSLIRTGSHTPVQDFAVDPQGDDNIAELCRVIHPRYILSTSNTFFERAPFVHRDSEGVKHFTRFVSMAPLDNALKQKFLYGFKLSTMPSTGVPNATPSPFNSLIKDSRKRRFPDSETYQQHSGQQHGGHRNKRSRAEHGESRNPVQCRFCMAADNFKTHLVTTVGVDAYLTLCKGPLTTCFTTTTPDGTPDGTPDVSVPTHLLIISTTHASTLPYMVDETNGENRSEQTFNEMTQFRKALQGMYFSVGKGALGTVTFEISMAQMMHVHWQAVAIDKKYTELSSSGTSLVEAAFLVGAENYEYQPFQVRDPGVGNGEGDFLRIYIWTPPTDEQPAGSEKCLTMPIITYGDKDRRNFRHAFPRECLAKLLGLDNRVYWADSACRQEVAEEVADADALNTAFKPFAFI